MNIRKLRTWKLKFLFWVEGTFGGLGGVCEVRYVKWGTQGEVSKVRFGWRGPLVGGVGYVRGGM